MRIGILGHGFIGWTGGVDFLRLIADSLVTADPTVELHFLLPVSGPICRVRGLLREIKRSTFRLAGRGSPGPGIPKWKHLQDYATGIDGKIFVHKIDAGINAIERAVRQHQIDVVLPSISPLERLSVPWVGYLYDYQHAYHPEFFSQREVKSRNRHFKAMLSSASHVLVNAKSVSDDIRRFNPESTAKIVTLPFSAAASPQWLDTAPPNPDKYGITHRYFIISNQFWQHKDHVTAWYALSAVLQRHSDVDLVCTGETFDYRNPAHMLTLVNLAQELGIENRLHILGLIPKVEQIGLVRGAIAMLQPSLFEGGPGGGAVFDAIALGVPCIVSDINVNKELDEPYVEFFEAGNAGALAQKMMRLLENDLPSIRNDRERLLLEGIMRRKRCGETLLGVLNQLI